MILFMNQNISSLGGGGSNKMNRDKSIISIIYAVFDLKPRKRDDKWLKLLIYYLINILLLFNINI